MSAKEKIMYAIKICEEEINGQNRYPTLPIIIESLKNMLDKMKDKDLSNEKKSKMAGAIGRIVTDDYSFMKSEIGLAIADAVNEFLK